MLNYLDIEPGAVSIMGLMKDRDRRVTPLGPLAPEMKLR